MTVDATITILILVSFLVVAVSGRLAVDFALVLCMTALLVSGVLTPNEAFQGFANPALFIIACFYVVSAAIKESGALHWWIMRWLGQRKPVSRAIPRIMWPVALISSVISNTPVVAIFIPLIQDWCRRHNITASKLLIPLSYASILGGTCTLIGTSTNLLVVGMLQGTPEADELSLFTPALVGLPLVVIGVLYFVVLGHRLLPARQGISESTPDSREYAVSMRVEEGGALSGMTIADAGLRHLQHSFLSELQSKGHVIPAVGPEEILKDNDILVFVGQPEAVSELRQFRGLVPAEGEILKLDVPYSSRALIEAVVSPTSNLVGKTVKESTFRTLFGGVILSVSRNGQRISQKVGSIVVRSGDTLLLEAARGFVRRHRYNRDFLLLSRIDDATIPNLSKAPVALGLLGLFIVLVVTGSLSLIAASLLLVIALGATKCISLEFAQRSVDMRLLLAIGASLALGFALQKTGLAGLAAQGIMSLADGNPYINLLLLYVVTVIVTELITNNAAAVLMFPLAQSLSLELDASLLPFVMTIMFAASASFLTPFGYQTNLMVQGPGGYQFGDYFRVGILLSLLVGATVVFLVPIVWPF
ncbi:MAG: SLC13 family permease [Porticoccaceae bacterium]|mgnify:FL=1|jgi:di/tricarboxylate transporter|nr:MAG: sodium:sulfate symporter [SAR92 bacterium BACL16 MAG-120619-bin48]MDP4653761.1 SLC13 family permease [Alphaproteobacteria bacterium]MDP4744679.1 SLC13 family permease [Porticoccaceae bacterium]MDP4753138.1 SLC13 family permease [Porticoccaceae bacterium]MDP4987012.1 SLC13 family permease [Porticoccaceae bacterium]